MLVDLEEVAVVHDERDRLEDVVRLVRAAGGTSELSASSRRFTGSVVLMRGGSSRLFDGRNESSSLIVASAPRSSSAAKCATPEVRLCVIAPPSSSFVTSS